MASLLDLLLLRYLIVCNKYDDLLYRDSSNGNDHIIGIRSLLLAWRPKIYFMHFYIYFGNFLVTLTEFVKCHKIPLKHYSNCKIFKIFLF